MSVDVRLATPDDYDQFMTLAAQYLVELRELGSEIRPTAKSLSMWESLFFTYVPPMYHDRQGAVVLVGTPAYGFSVAGELGPMLTDTDFGRTAYGHGTYVHPHHRRQGLSRLLRDRMREELKAQGFQTIVGGVHINNDLGALSLKDSTFTWYQMVGYERL